MRGSGGGTEGRGCRASYVCARFEESVIRASVLAELDDLRSFGEHIEFLRRADKVTARHPEFLRVERLGGSHVAQAGLCGLEVAERADDQDHDGKDGNAGGDATRHALDPIVTHVFAQGGGGLAAGGCRPFALRLAQSVTCAQSEVAVPVNSAADSGSAHCQRQCGIANNKARCRYHLSRGLTAISNTRSSNELHCIDNFTALYSETKYIL